MSQKRGSKLGALLAAVAIAALVGARASAQGGPTGGFVQGVVAAGAPVKGNPVQMGGSDGTNVQALKLDSSGRLVLTGPAPAGGGAAGNPFVVAGVDGSSNVRIFLTDTNGVALTSLGLNFAKDTVTNFSTASNGVTAVTLGPALTGGQRVYPAKLLVYNSAAATTHTVTFKSSGGATLLGPFALSAGASFILDNDNGAIRSALGEAFQFVIDAGGAAADCTASGAAVQK